MKRIVLAFALIWATHANAISVTVEFEGTVSSARFTDEALVGLVKRDDPVRGKFTYDTETRDSDPQPTRGLYVHTSPEFRLELNVGSAFIQTDPADPELWIQILDNHPLGIAPDGLDRFDVISRSQTPIWPSSTVPGQLQILLSDSTNSVFDSDALPIVPPPIDAFNPQGAPFAQGQIATLSNQDPTIFINFGVDAWRVVPQATPLPEPSSLLIFLLGFILTAVRTGASEQPR